MRQMVSGFAIGSFSITMLVAPCLMTALNLAPSYSSAIETLAHRAGLEAPLQAAAAELEVYRYNLMHPVTDFIGHHIFPRLPSFPKLPQ